ncbi:MAG TPA: glycosyl hydrolase family 65 protein [Terriglobales bacterium]|nr:glycosyl hydrolase family 65 protein [Terriglobales bacterium]
MRAVLSPEKQASLNQKSAYVDPDQFRKDDRRWLLVEEGFALPREHEIESLFAIANGYVGNRGSLAEGSALSAPATFIAGVFTQADTPGAIPELMTLPDWTGLRIWVDDHPLSIERGVVLEHRRILDLHRGILWREWRHRDPDGRITRIRAFRLASLADRHLLLHSVSLTAENYSSAIRFDSSIEVPEGAVYLAAPDWKMRADSARPNVLPLAMRVPGRDTTVAFGVTSQLLGSNLSGGKREVELDQRLVSECCEAQLELGGECHLQRLISVFSSKEAAEPFESVVKHLNEVIPRGVRSAVSTHVSEWESRWQAADIEIEGDESLQQALRFAGYHLISAADPDNPLTSVGARALTGAAYKGHVFWDTEIYMLPYYIYTHPPSARALLEYRYHTLEAAREKARAYGFRGAMYPWESADTGEEVTPPSVIAPNGEVLRILNGQMEIHITADVAYGVWDYWQATGDDDFFENFGAEIMLDTARFWASRGVMESDGAFHIRHVIGPDEYHDNVDDNAYTNLMAAWNLRRASEAAQLVQERWPDKWNQLRTQLQLTASEILDWTKFAQAMYTGFDLQTRLFEQFSGYFRKEQVDLKSYEPRTSAMDIILGHDRIQQTNIVKQADVVLATFLLWDEISPEIRAANFRYYEPRTGHGSSLSPSIHALLAARVGEQQLAQQYLKQGAEIDLGNNMGNAAGGVHAAALGGLWQAIVFGFAGLRRLTDGISLAPKLMPHWKRLAFPIQWRGRQIRLSMKNDSVYAVVSGTESLTLRVQDGPSIDAMPGHEYTTDRSAAGWQPWRSAPRAQA